MTLRSLVFGPTPAPEQTPGVREQFPINWGQLRFAVIFCTALWLVLSAVVLKPGIARWIGKGSTFFENRWVLLFLVSVGALSMVLMVVRRYQRAVGLVFTTEGIWIPTWRGGGFLPWPQVYDVKLKDYGRGATDIELSHPGGRFRIHAVAFADPYAVSRFVRAHVGEGLGSALPVEGEI